MGTFDHLLNWKLKEGSHPFPGPDGGTCINEAALIAAGFEYKPVECAEQMPECFSRPICRFAMRLNDRASDEERQFLLPYVTRLACADTPEIERQRGAYIVRHTRASYPSVPLQEGLKVLEGALSIGRQAYPLGPEEVKTRMDAARAGKPQPSKPTASASLQDQPFLSKVKS